MLEIWRIIQVCVVMSFSETDATKRVREQNLPSITPLFQWWNPSSSKAFVFLPRIMVEIWRIDHVSADKASNQALDSKSLMTSSKYTCRWLGSHPDRNLLHPFNCLHKLYNSKPWWGLLLTAPWNALLSSGKKDLCIIMHSLANQWM